MPTKLKIELTKHVFAPLVTQPLIDHIWELIKHQIHIPTGWSQVSVVVVDDAEMKRLNRRYRQEASVTDVLSFPYGQDGGEIVLCYPQAKRQAKLKQGGLPYELNWLLVHGLLHLLGYDHERARDAKIMRPLEQHILAYV